MYLHQVFNLNNVILALFISLLFTFTVPNKAFSQTTTDLTTQQGTVGGAICNVVGELRGPVARGVAAVGIIILGFSLFLGKISWGVALSLAIGVGAIFGAPQIVAVLGDGTESCVDADAAAGAGAGADADAVVTP